MPAVLLMAVVVVVMVAAVVVTQYFMLPGLCCGDFCIVTVRAFDISQVCTLEETHSAWCQYFRISLFQTSACWRQHLLHFFKASPPFSICSVPQYSRQAISRQRPDNYGDCSNTSKSPGHKSLRAQCASSLPHTSFAGWQFVILSAFSAENQLECVRLSLTWAWGELKRQSSCARTHTRTNTHKQTCQ